MIDQVGRVFVAGQEETVAHDAAIEAEFGGTGSTSIPCSVAPMRWRFPVAEGGHGGGDMVMLEQLSRRCRHRIHSIGPPAISTGTASILMGIAANRSLATGLPVHVDDLLRLP